MWAGRACLAGEMSRVARPTLNPGQALGGGQMPSAPRSPGQGPDLPSGMPVPSRSEGGLGRTLQDEFALLPLAHVRYVSHQP